MKSYFKFVYVLFIFLLEIILLIYHKIELASYNLLLFILVIFLFSKNFSVKIPKIYFLGFIFVGFLNALGGLIFVNGQRLYDSSFYFLRFDMFIHFFALFLITLVIYRILKKYCKVDKKILILICVFFSLGLGALYEIFEFFGVVVFNHKGVGDYFNNSLDLVFNLIGSLFAGSYILYKKI